MFIKLLGSTREEQLVATAAFVVIFSLLLIGAVLVVAPLSGGDTTVESKISTETIKVLASLITGAFGFLLGSGMSKNKETSDGD